MVVATDVGRPVTWDRVRTFAWITLSAAWFGVAFASSIGVAAIAQEFGNLRYMAMSASWAGIGIVGYVVTAMVAGVWRDIGWGQLRLILGTVAAGTLLVSAFAAWALARYDTLDPDVLQGATVIPFLAVGACLWAAASTVVIRSAALVSMGIASLGMIGLALSAVANLGGLADGLSMEGGWLAITGTALTVAWAACARTVGLRRSI